MTAIDERTRDERARDFRALMRAVDRDDDEPRPLYGASCPVHGQWMRSWIQVDAEDFRQRHETCGVRPVRIYDATPPGSVLDMPWRAGCRTHGAITDLDGPAYVSRPVALLAAEAHLKANHAREEA